MFHEHTPCNPLLLHLLITPYTSCIIFIVITLQKSMMYKVNFPSILEGRNFEVTTNNGMRRVIPIFDVPHMVKCMRNNLLTKDLEIGNKVSKRNIL